MSKFPKILDMTSEAEFYRVPNQVVSFLNDSSYFNTVYINPRAAISMLKHSITGGEREIVGYLLGHFHEETHSYYITEAVMIPVVGTGFSISPDGEKQFLSIQRIEDLKTLGHSGVMIGWYHSHPGLHVFFSRIDCNSHRKQWLSSDGHFVGLVIDPITTKNTGRLQLGAYSTYKRDELAAKEKGHITPEKFREYGDAWFEYYELKKVYFVSESDEAFFNDIFAKSYSSTLKTSPLEETARYTISSENKKKERGDGGDDRDSRTFEDKIESVNTDRHFGLYVNKLKRIVFQ